MKLKIDFKSALIGLCIGIIAALVLGAAEAPSQQIGRYQIQTCPGNAGSTGFVVLADTATGKVWMANGTSGQLRSDVDFFQPKADR